MPLTVDYTCFLVKCINYQNGMCLKIIYFLQDLARFLQKLQFFARNPTLAKFLQEMSNCSKIVARILQDLLSNSPILQDMYFLQEFCKSCIDCKDFARFWQKLFFLWTRVSIGEIRTTLPSSLPEKQTIRFWQQILVVGFEFFKASQSIKVIKIETSHQWLAKWILNAYGSQGNDKMFVMNVIAKSLTVFI